MTILYIIIGIIVIILLWIAGAYNGFISRVNRTKEAWADIDVQLKRRYDLIPNLVETVKGYAAHESGVFEAVTAARTAAMSVGTGATADKAQAENQLSGALKSLFAVSEAYPDLKANQNFLELQRELSDTEDKIQASRRFYNSNVRDLNTAIQQFPGNIIASSFHISTMNLFELGDADAAAREPVSCMATVPTPIHSELFRIALTGIVWRTAEDGSHEYLITRRAMHKKAWPGKWTVPGGGFEVEDYINTDVTYQNDESPQWYHVLENGLRREIKEEVGLEVKDIRLLEDIAFVRPDGVPAVVLSYYCKYVSGDVALDEDASEFAWIHANNVGDYELIQGIDQEIKDVEKILLI